MAPKASEVKILPRRFELMKKIYMNNKFIGRNRFLVINWFLEKIGHFQDNPHSYTCELLWKTFHDILEIESHNPGDRILLKSDAITNLLNAVANYPLSCCWASTILSSIATFLQTSALNSSLIVDVDKLFLLLISTLKIVCKIYEGSNKDDQSLKHAKELSNIILDILENLPSSNEEEKASLLADNLQELALFMYISENYKDLEYLGEKLAKKMVAIVFNMKLKHFETLLASPEMANLMERPNTYILEFFFSLQKLLFNENIAFNSVSVNTTCGTLMKKLLSTFLIQNKSSLHSLKVISLLFAVGGLDIPIVVTANSCCNSLFKGRKSNFDISIVAIANLLEGCSTVPQYFTSMTVPDGYLKPSTWLKGVSAALLDVKNNKNKSSWLKCFHSLLMISPSIIEDDICLLIKIALLNISVHSTESKKQYCELFDIILKTHSKLHQLPKFFVKLLLALIECIKEDSGGNLLENGQILVQVQDSIARCVQELPYGQMIELWKIFIETFSTLENMSQVFMVKKGFIFFVAQLFSNFLLHAQLFQANIPTNIYSQFNTLIENTTSEIKKIIPSLKETDSKFLPTQRSILLLLYAIGEVKLAYNAYYGNLPKMPEVRCEEIFDFSILHSCLENTCSLVLQSFMNSDDKILSSLVFQLLLQKIKALQFKESFSDEDVSHMQECISVALKSLQECSSTDPWDMDICTVNDKNYGTAYWMMFLKISPLLLNHLSPRNFYSFCNTAQAIILQDSSSECGVKSLILDSFKNEFFQECKHFQTAFISAIWKQENLISSKKRSHEDMDAEQNAFDKIFFLLNAYHSKALKYSERTPKSNKNLGSTWNEIKEISTLLNGILSSESLPKGKLIINKIRDLIKLFRCLPLEYLLPGNQMKCIIGLSLILFLMPQSCKLDEAVPICKEISQLLLSIFEGVRSIWLFDFVSSGPYLKYVVKTLELVLNVECNDNQDWAIQLIEQLASLIIRNVDSLESAEPFISELAIKHKCTTAVLVTFYAFLKKLSQILPRPHKQEKYKETLIKMSSVIVKGFIKQMEVNFKEDIKTNDYSYYIKCYMQVIEIICGPLETEQISKNFEFFPVVLEKALYNVKSSNVNALSDLCLLFISKVCKYSDKLSAFLPKDFVSTSWKIFLTHFEEKGKKKMESFSITESVETHTELVLDCKFCVFCSFLRKVHIQVNNKDVEHVKHFDENVLEPLALNQFEEESLKILSAISTPEVLAEVFNSLVKEMGVNNTEKKSAFLMQMTVLIFQRIIDANNDKCQQLLVNRPIQELLSHLFLMANKACSSIMCQTMVKIPILDFLNFLIKGNKGFPKDILFQSLHCVAPVSLDVCDDNYELYVKSFNAVWNVVYNLFMHHTSIMLGVPALLLIYVKKLLKSIVKAGGAIPLAKCDISIFQQVQLCAQNMTRLLTVITRQKTEFSKLVPYLVTYYVDTVQHITLNSNIKDSILLGIYRLLDICSEESIKMQAVNIDSMSREVYENLVKNYRQNKHKIFA